MVLAGCGTASLVTFLLILIFVRKTNKPIRPKIKKKYVVHKNMDQSCRPTTEQCEIIIEDCCNMNICDTVSFSLWFLKTNSFFKTILSIFSPASIQKHFNKKSAKPISMSLLHPAKSAKTTNVSFSRIWKEISTSICCRT